MRTLTRILTAPLYAVAAIIVLLEDWLWDDLQRLAAWFGHLPVFRQIEALILRAPRGVALLLFLTPSLVLIPVKLLALYFISGGHALIGLLTILGAKIAGTALVARLFTLTKPKLLTFTWFSWLYERIVAFKSRIYTVIKSSAIYKTVHETLMNLRARFKAWSLTRTGGRSEKKSWLKRRWHALLRHHRQQEKENPASTSAHTASAPGGGESAQTPARRGKPASRRGYSGARPAEKSPRSRAKPRRARS